MIFLSFSNACKFFFTIFLLFVFTSVSILSQTRIKERAGINPEEKKKLLRLNKTNSTESLWIQVSGQFGWSAVLEGPCSVNSTASGNNGTIKYISVSNPPVGTYRLRITQYFPGAVPGEQGPGGEVSYTAGYTGFSRDSASFSYNSSFQWAIGQTSRTSEFTFNLNYRNDFVVYTNGSVCTNKTQGVILNSFTTQDCSKTTFFNSSDSVHLSIKNNNADLVFYDNSAGLSLGKNTTAATAQLSSIVLKLNSPFYGAAESDTLTAVFNGVLRSSTVLVEPSTKNFSLTADDNFHVVHGFSKTVNVAASPIDDCNEPFPDSSVKYNLEIINGMQLGSLKNISNGSVGKTLRNIDQIEGRMKFQFIADGDIPVSEEIITVRISASSPDITGRDISFFVNSNDIIVTFLPQSIRPKDTTDVVLKMRDSTGAVVDFPENQLFDLEISDGINYGDLLYKYRNLFWVGAKQIQSAYIPFKFVAIDTTLSGSIQSTVLVSTNKDGNTLWGEGTIEIKTGSDCSDAPQCNEPIIPIINFVKIDTSLCDKTNDLGNSALFVENFQKNFKLNACYNQKENKWQFQIANNLEYATQVCIRQNYIYILDTSQVKNLQLSPAELDNLYIDIIQHDDRLMRKYVIQKAILEHEEIHIEKNINILNFILASIQFYREITSYALRCEDAGTMELASNKATEYFKGDILLTLYEKYKNLKRNLEGNQKSTNPSLYDLYIANEKEIQDDERIKETIEFYKIFVEKLMREKQ